MLIQSDSTCSDTILERLKHFHEPHGVVCRESKTALFQQWPGQFYSLTWSYAILAINII